MMTPEDIRTGLQSIAANEQLNPRQRDIMTEGAALIKYQQYKVDEADGRRKEAEAALKQAEDDKNNAIVNYKSCLAMLSRFKEVLKEMSECSFEPSSD